MRWMGLIGTVLFGSSVVVAGARAQMTPEQVAAERQRFDFKVGQWSVEAKIRNSGTTYVRGTGTLDIEWDDGGVLVAAMDIAFEDFAVVGTTLRRFDPASGVWDIAWQPVDGDTVPDIEGRFRDGRFIEINYGSDARGPFIGRLVVFDMTHDHFSVRKDRLYDDGAVAQEIWVYEATRVKRP